MRRTHARYVIKPARMVKQSPWSEDCVVCCCAMLANQTREEAHQWMGTKVGEKWTDPMAYAYLLRFGIAVGEGFGLETPTNIGETDILVREIELKKSPALLHTVVDTVDDKTASHMIVWDGEQVWDPSSYVEGLRSLSEYKISDIWRIFKLPARFLKQLSRLRMT